MPRDEGLDRYAEDAREVLFDAQEGLTKSELCEAIFGLEMDAAEQRRAWDRLRRELERDLEVSIIGTKRGRRYVHVENLRGFEEARYAQEALTIMRLNGGAIDVNHERIEPQTLDWLQSNGFTYHSFSENKLFLTPQGWFEDVVKPRVRFNINLLNDANNKLENIRQEPHEWAFLPPYDGNGWNSKSDLVSAIILYVSQNK